MPLRDLPSFHRDALRTGFLQHLTREHAAGLLDDEEYRLLQLLAAPPQTPTSAAYWRLDGLDALSAEGQALPLDSSVFISDRAARVFLYNPDIGLQRLVDRHQAKGEILKKLGQPSTALAYVRYATPEQQGWLATRQFVQVQVNLLDVPLFDHLMLTLNSNLNRALWQMHQLLSNQPEAEQAISITLNRAFKGSAHRPGSIGYLAPYADAAATPAPLDDLLLDLLREPQARFSGQWFINDRASSDEATPGTALQRAREILPKQCQRILEHYWSNAPAGKPSRREQLASLLRCRLQHVIEQAHQQGALGALEYRNLSSWLTPGDTPLLRTYAVALMAADQPAILLDALLVIASGNPYDAPCFTYSARHGLERFPSAKALLASISAPHSRPHWLECAAPGQRLRLSKLAFDNCQLVALAAPGLQPFVDSLLDGQRQRLAANLAQPSGIDLHACFQQARELGALLDPQLADLAPLNPARPSLRVLQQVAATLANPASTASEPHLLQQLLDDYGLMQSQRPGLRAITQALLHLHLGGLLTPQVPLTAITVRPAAAQATQPLHALAWHFVAAQQAARPVMQRYQLVAESVDSDELATRLPWSVLEQALNKVAQALPLRLEKILARDAQYTQAYQRRLRSLCLTLERRLPGAAQRPPPTWLSSAFPGPATTVQRYSDLLAGFEQGLAAGLPASELERLAHDHDSLDRGMQALQRLDDLALDLQQGSQLPEWLSNASTAQRQHYLQALLGSLASGSGARDYLFEVPTLDQYSREHLQKQLDLDFGHASLHADDIQVTSNRWIAAPVAIGQIPSAIPAAYERHRQSLVSYAQNHFHDWQNPILHIELATGAQPPKALNASYLRNLVRQVDIGSRYQLLLRATFEPSDAHYEQRLKLFCQQLPGQLLETAWRARLQGALDDRGLACIQQLMLMPQSSSRAAIDGGKVELMPLLLQCADLAPDPVPGLCLISPGSQGPLLLYCPHEASAPLRQFRHEQDLLQQLKTDQALQQLLLSRLPPDTRKRYAHGGFSEPHLPVILESDFDLPWSRPAPPHLVLRPIQGNILRWLFLDNVQQLQAMAKAQLSTADKVRWQAFTQLLGELWQTVSLFLPGRLGSLLACWQVELAAVQALDSIGRHHWSEALAQLGLGLVQALLLGANASAGEPKAQFWNNVRKLAQYDTTLRHYEAPGQELASLQLDPSTQVYRTVTGEDCFVDLNSRIYHARESASHWYLQTRNGEPGPRLLLATNKRWLIDPAQPLPLEYGGALSNLSGRFSRWRASRADTVILAVGMRRIQRLFPGHARKIRDAHRIAVHHLVTCHSNLDRASAAQLSPETAQILETFFELPQVTDDILELVRSNVQKLLAKMLATQYSPLHSQRYVLGSDANAPAGTLAFVLPFDYSGQVFLLDDFFNFSPSSYLPLKLIYHPEEAADMTRAMTILHEFSHLACETRDIRYLDGTTPYADWLVPGDVRTRIEGLHQDAFSARTPANQLFVVQTPAGQLRDLQAGDRSGLRLILEITGAQDLNDARLAFYSDVKKRVRIMLANADSLILLIYQLSRTLHP
ncbi:dermonecrotic toxin domain-containing protein [Pseudomonas sp. NPDC090755]|uniref:dermonecrotic toxin domain-containing protein n=1 Tax=Pseudomonas sp. NPDC090755 TaxID=3364481 RepID=UPI00383A5C0A